MTTGSPATVLFLCTGNYYRSRYAELLFNWESRRRGLNWQADSRGLRLEPLNPGPISRHTIVALRTLGVDVAEPIRFPQAVSAADFHAARHVVAVKELEHRPLIEQHFPDWLSRVEFWRVDDVDCAVPAVALPLLRQHVIALLDRLATSDGFPARGEFDETRDPLRHP